MPFFLRPQPHWSQCLLNGPAGSASVRPSANSDKLAVHLIPSSSSSTTPRTWWCLTSMCFWFWLSGFFVKVRHVILSPNISMLLTACSGSSLFRNLRIQTPSLAPWLIATYLVSDVDVNTVRCCLWQQVIIVPPKKKQYPVTNFRSSMSPA